MQGFIDLLRLYAVLIDLFQIHLFLDTLAPCLMGADGLFDTGVVKQRPQLFGDKVDEKFGVKLLQFEVEGLCAVLAEPVAQQVALRLFHVPKHGRQVKNP